MTLDVSQWRTARVLARRCGVTRVQILRWYHEGKLDRVKVGWNDYRYWWSDGQKTRGIFLWVGNTIKYIEE